MSKDYKFIMVTRLQMVSSSQSSQTLLYRLKARSGDWWKHSGEKLTYYALHLFILNTKFKANPATIKRKKVPSFIKQIFTECLITC